MSIHETVYIISSEDPGDEFVGTGGDSAGRSFEGHVPEGSVYFLFDGHDMPALRYTDPNFPTEVDHGTLQPFCASMRPVYCATIQLHLRPKRGVL